MTAPPEPLRIGVVARCAFCPRRAWLEVHGEHTDTGQVAQGLADHATVDDPGSSRLQRLRSVEVHSDELGVVGRCDTVEIGEDGRMTVVEHKSAPVRRKSEVTCSQRVQLALQALCLRAEGHDVSGGAVWFSTTRRRVEVPLDDDLLAETRRLAVKTRTVVDSPVPPAPLEDDPRCGRCSHVGVCLPDEHRRRPSARRIGVADPAGSLAPRFARKPSEPASRADPNPGR